MRVPGGHQRRLSTSIYTTESAIPAQPQPLNPKLFMYEITTQMLSFEEANLRYSQVGDFTTSTDVMTGEHPPCVGMEYWLPISHEKESLPLHALFVRCRGIDRVALRSLASHELWHMNVDSENLLRQESFLILGPEEGGLYLPLEGSSAFALGAGSNGIRMLLIADEWVVDVTHRLTGDDLEDYLLGCQAALASSGSRYIPSRVYDDTTLDERANHGHEFVVSGHMVHLLNRSS